MMKRKGKYSESVAARRWGDDPDTWHVIRGPSGGYHPTFYH